MTRPTHRRWKKPAQFLDSKRALAVPMTYLILFASLLGIISVTYTLAVSKISAGGALIKASMAKHNMLVLDDAVRSLAWSANASKILHLDDCGGNFRSEPASKHLRINITDNQSFQDIVFNSSVGRVFYVLESSEFSFDGIFIRGDARSVLNESSSIMTQLYTQSSVNGKELVLCYRPSATAGVIAEDGTKPENLVRIYILTLNNSQTFTFQQESYLKAMSVETTSVESQYDINQSISSLEVASTLDGISTSVWLPILSNEEGAYVTVEIVLCMMKIQKVEI